MANSQRLTTIIEYRITTISCIDRKQRSIKCIRTKFTIFMTVYETKLSFMLIRFVSFASGLAITLSDWVQTLLPPPLKLLNKNNKNTFPSPVSVCASSLRFKTSSNRGATQDEISLWMSYINDSQCLICTRNPIFFIHFCACVDFFFPPSLFWFTSLFIAKQ